MTATKTWKTSDGNTITVATTRGVAGPGETVPATESLSDWKTRHAGRVAAAESIFPPVASAK